MKLKIALTTIIMITALSGVCIAATYAPFFQDHRKKLMHEGWAPLKFNHRETNEFPVTGEEAELVEAQINEVESCSIDGGVLCTLWYTKRKSCLKLTTRGEGLKNMHVILQEHESCPEQKAKDPQAKNN